MKQYLEFLDNILMSAVDRLPVEPITLFGNRYSITTVSKVTNISREEIIDVLKKERIQVIENWISEDELNVFLNWYVRRLKNYFKNSINYFHYLSFNEFTDLNKFYRRFRKSEVENSVFEFHWSNIDTEVIKDTIFQEIKRLEEESFNFAWWSYGDIFIRKFESNDQLLRRVIRNRFCELKKISVKKTYCIINDIIRNIMISCRYHIYATDDDGNISNLVDTIFVIRKYKSALLESLFGLESFNSFVYEKKCKKPINRKYSAMQFV